MKDALGHGSDPRGGEAAHQQAVGQVGQHVPLKAESPMARELRLFADNDANLHRQSFAPVMQNLQKKFDKGVYAPDKATTLFGYHADRAAQAYSKEHGSPGQAWHQMFPPAVRREAAQHWEHESRSELQHGNYRKSK